MAETIPLKSFEKDPLESVTVGTNQEFGNNVTQNQAEEQDETAKRIAQVMAIGSGLKMYAEKYNPLKGVQNFADATVKVRREAKNLFNPTEFSKPADRAQWMSRVSANTAYFRLSYTICFCFTTVYFILTSPFLIFEIGVLGAIWALFFRINKADDVITVGQYQLGRKEKMMVFIPLTIFVAFFGGLLSSLIYIMLIGALLVLTHASFRHPVEADPLDSLDEGGVNVPPPDFV